MLKHLKEFYELVESFDLISIFRHVSPDGDAYGSSWGLTYFLREKYPDKTILMASLQEGSLKHFFEASDDVTLEMIQSSLAIVCDTANQSRIDGDALRAKKIIKIDHHPTNDNYGHVNIIDNEVSSCSQIIAQLCLNDKEVLDPKISRVLYAGMLTDTVSFTISSVNSQTLLIASKLLQSGIDVGLIHDELFQIDANVYDYVTYLRTHAIEHNNGLIYCYIEPDVLDKFQLTINQAKEMVNTFKEKQGAKIWLLLIKEKSGLYRTTIRSRGIVVNDIASEFGGGGHKFAAATKDLSLLQTEHLLDKLNEKLNIERDC